jgi:hypothetical protein
MGADLDAGRRLAGAQDHRDRAAFLGVVDMDMQKAALVAAAVESGCDFFAGDGWKGEGGGRIVDHGGCGWRLRRKGLAEKEAPNGARCKSNRRSPCDERCVQIEKDSTICSIGRIVLLRAITRDDYALSSGDRGELRGVSWEGFEP